MNTRIHNRSFGKACAALATLAALSGIALAADTTRVIYSFSEGKDGGYPDTDLVVDAAGNLYGMAVEGGDYGAGAVFRLAPSPTGWIQTVLYSFTGGPDGGQPYGGVTLDAQGNLYGTTVIGGSGGTCVEEGCGVVFKLTNSGGTWSESVIHDFTGGSDGYGPGGPVVFDSRGRLYGTTPTGGTDGFGIIYQLTPQPAGDWVEAIIHTFSGGEDGGTGSAGRLLADPSGTIFGTATVGGANGAGTVYALTESAAGTWTFDTLYAFKGEPDGVFPYGGLVRDAAGRLFGTTYYGGSKGIGVVYQLEFSGGAWNETVLHDFLGERDGSSSISGLVFDAAGNLYGTTSEGGAQCNCGTIFKLTPGPAGTWTESIVHRFTGTPDGSYAYAGLVADATGSLYGATVRGGIDNEGAVFRYAP